MPNNAGYFVGAWCVLWLGSEVKPWMEGKSAKRREDWLLAGSWVDLWGWFSMVLAGLCGGRDLRVCKSVR